jgi:hypothetical protein
MNTDYSNRKHESPFTDYPPREIAPVIDNLPENAAPIAGDAPPPKIAPLKQFGVHSGSEQGQFRVFMAMGFVAVGTPVSVWAYWCLTGKEYGGDPDRQLLEGSLTAAAALICFGIAFFLLVRARQIFRQVKADKCNYAPLNRQLIPVLKTSVKVNSTTFQDVLLGFLILFFGGTSLLFLLGAAERPRNILVALINLSLLFFICRLIFKAKKKLVRSFEPAGILRGDRRLIPWQDFRGATTLTTTSRFGSKYIWRIELAFADGEEAWIIPQRIKNFQEICNFVDTLPRAVLKDVQ